MNKIFFTQHGLKYRNLRILLNVLLGILILDLPIHGQPQPTPGRRRVGRGSTNRRTLPPVDTRVPINSAIWCPHCRGSELGINNSALGGASGRVGTPRVFYNRHVNMTLGPLQFGDIRYAVVTEPCRSCNVVGWMLHRSGTVPAQSSWAGTYGTTRNYPFQLSDQTTITNVRQEGATHGCHSCGGGLYMTFSPFHADHIPPGAIMRHEVGIGTLYNLTLIGVNAPINYDLGPHCFYCSNTQSVMVRRFNTEHDAVATTLTPRQTPPPTTSDQIPLRRHDSRFRLMRTQLLASGRAAGRPYTDTGAP